MLTLLFAPIYSRAASKTIKDPEANPGVNPGANTEEGIDLPSGTGTSSFGVQADMDDTRF